MTKVCLNVLLVFKIKHPRLEITTQRKEGGGFFIKFTNLVLLKTGII